MTMMDDIVNRLTPAAKEVLEFAKKEAERFRHNYVGTEHLLLGIIGQGKPGKSFALKVLTSSGIEISVLVKFVESRIGVGPEIASISNIPFTPRVKKVLALALRESRQMKCEYVGPEHLLLGILLEGDGIAAEALRFFGTDPGRMRADTLKELGLVSPQTPKTEMEKVLEILNGSAVVTQDIAVRLCDVKSISFTVVGKAFNCNSLLFACLMASAEGDGYLGLKKLHSVIGEVLIKSGRKEES